MEKCSFVFSLFFLHKAEERKRRWISNFGGVGDGPWPIVEHHVQTGVTMYKYYNCFVLGCVIYMVWEYNLYLNSERRGLYMPRTCSLSSSSDICSSVIDWSIAIV